MLSSAERRLAAASAVCGFALGILSAHRGLYNDGIFFVQWLSDWPLLPGEKHVWLYPHLLYLPLAKGFHAFVNLFTEVRIDESLKWFSAVGLGVAGPFLVRFFSAFMGLAANAMSTLLTFLAPSVWYFAGATEIHMLHLAAAAFALSMAARPPGRAPNAAFVAGAVALEATHLTGILLIPAMLLFRERARRRGLTSDPAGWFRLGCLSAAGIAGLTLVAVGAHFAFEEHSVLKDYFKWMHSGEQSYFSTVQVELFRRAGILVGLGFPCAIVLVKREWALLGAWWATLALYAVMIAISKVEYQGGYNIAAIPVFAVGIGAALQIAWDRSKKPWPTVVGVIGLALVVWQGVDGYGQVRRPMASDSARERAESIRQVASTSDAVILDVRPKDVEFDLTQLPNLTRLYLGGDAPNVALLDEKNASGVPYLTEAAGDAYAKRIEASIDKALADGHRAFVFESVWTPEASRPRLQRLANGLAQRFAAKGPTRQSGFVELERRGG